MTTLYLPPHMHNYPGIRSTTTFWDSPVGEGWFGGEIDDLIVEHIEPKYKHGYRGNFPGSMSALNYLIKTMDRPKIDLESIDQLRNNVVRRYPIRYNFGDVSFSFWDDIKHVTVSTLTQYFHGQVWEHGGSKGGRGSFLLRDSAIIGSFDVIDYVMDHRQPLTYTFYNALMSSMDFDAHDDESDEGVHTVQLVLKVEGYSIRIGGPPYASGSGEHDSVNPEVMATVTNTFNSINQLINESGSTGADAATAGL